MRNVIAVAAHKGGVGKTTTALGLSAGLVLEGYRVLLVDLDPQGHSTLGLGFDVSDEAPTVRDVFGEAGTLPRWPTECGVYLSPATIRLERAAAALYARPKREQVLARVLAAPLPFDWIIIDCPPSLGPLTENALVAADHVLIPCRMEARAADGLVDLLEVLAVLRGESFDEWSILRTQRDLRKTVTNAAVDAALAPWRPKLRRTTIPMSEALNQAQIARQDIFTFEASSIGARAYRELVAEVVGAWRPRAVSATA